jgi:PAS domain S-box-containing protein
MVAFIASGLSLVGFFVWPGNGALLITILIATLALIWVFLQLSKQNRLLEQSVHLLTGKSESKISVKELPAIIDSNNQKFKLVTEHIKQLGNIQELNAVHESLLQDEVGQTLLAVQSQMRNLKEEEDKQHWISNGLAKFTEVLRKKESIQEYGASIISALVKHVGANQGGLFLGYEDAEEGPYLELIGSYAYEKRRYVNKRIQPGEGLLGQCMYEKDIIFITDVPKDYVHITSGLGLATPRNIVVIPLLLNEVFFGVFEIASFEILKPHQVEFLKKVAVMIASEIGSMKTLDHTKALLAESDQLSHRLQAQEEAMRMNLEELTTVQEEMKRHQTELEGKQAELSSYLSAIDNTIASAEFTLEGKLTAANNSFLTLTGYTTQQIKGKSYVEIFNNDQSLQLMWENLQLGKFFSGEFRMRDHDGKELWMNGTLNPILDSQGNPEKVMLFAQFTTQEKEKLNELSGMVQAIKQTLPVLECTPDLQCKSANDKFMKMFGVSRLELRNKKLSDFMLDQNLCIDSTVLEKNDVQRTLEFVVAGQVQKWEVSVSTIPNLSGNINRVVIMFLHESEGRVVQMAV